MRAVTAIFETLQVSHPRPGVAQITMARPGVFNAFDETMIGELDAAFTQAARDDSVRVIVLAGQGKHFSAGADLKWMQRSSTASLEWNLADARRFAAMLARIQSCPKPTLARIQGSALGGGVGLCCACDLAVAADDAAFSVSEARFGILPAVISPYLVAAVGKRWHNFWRSQLPVLAQPRHCPWAWCTNWLLWNNSTLLWTPASLSYWLQHPAHSGKSNNFFTINTRHHGPRNDRAHRTNHQPSARHRRGPRWLYCIFEKRPAPWVSPL